jgi:hypothetical protein
VDACIANDSIVWAVGSNIFVESSRGGSTVTDLEGQKRSFAARRMDRRLNSLRFIAATPEVDYSREAIAGEFQGDGAPNSAAPPGDQYTLSQVALHLYFLSAGDNSARCRLGREVV